MTNMIAIPGFSEPFSSISHLIACALAILGALLLLRKGRGNMGRQMSLLIFSFGLIFQFSMSGIYHLLEPELTPRYVLQVLDHAAIWVLIAGTFTPIHTILFRGILRWGILGSVWLLTINGVVLTSIFFESIPEWLTLTFFIGLGWIGVITFWNVKSKYSDGKVLYVILGGVAYTTGAVLEFTRWPILWPGVIGPHEIFHIFVILGAFAHWSFIYSFADFPISSEFIIHVIENPNGKLYAYSRTEKIEFFSDTKGDLHQQISLWVEENYHNSMRPSRINLKYSKEEDIS
jgi:hemolysin III